MSGPTIDTTRPSASLRIGSERRLSGSGGVYQHINSHDGTPDAEIPMAGASEIDDAVQSAHGAFLTWRQTSPAVRRKLLMRLADLIEDHSDEFVRLGTLDNGTRADWSRDSSPSP